MAQFEIFKDRQERFRMRLRANNEVVIARSATAYANKVECEYAIALAKRVDRSKFEVFKDHLDKFRWRMRTARRQVIALSPKGYPSRRACRRVISTVKRVAPEARVVDLTEPDPNKPPVASFTATPETGEAPLDVDFDASASSDPDGTITSYAWDFGDGQGATGVSATHTYSQAGGYTAALTVTDEDGATASAVRSIMVVAALDPTAATDLASATSFLYTGDNPVQTGIVPETIEMGRAAVLRGRVVGSGGAPLPDVTVTVLDHDEFGRTLTRTDGMFDLAVNGGAVLNVCYEKEGYLHSQWQVDVPWQDFVSVPDAVMLEPDIKVSTVDLSSSEPHPPVRGTPSEDEDGIRQATLLFPQETSAQMRLTDGSTQELTTLDVRATEFTVGERGPDAMPAELPPTSAYTYAFELNADEAVDAGASAVEFDRPVPFYVENFLGFEVGTVVPAGSYKREQGQWIPSENGRVLKITGVTDGKADVDSVGEMHLPNGEPLPAVEIDDAERRRLAELYETGQELWRVPVDHFTDPIDLNFPVLWPADSTFPGQPRAGANDRENENCESRPASVILTQSQVLGEDLALTGTAFGLHYGSDRVPGRKALLRIPLSGPSIPRSLLSIELQVRVGGRMFKREFPPSPNLSTVFPWDGADWDGTDAYGRTVQGAMPVTVRIGYAYRNVVYARASLEGPSGGGGGGPVGGRFVPEGLFAGYGDTSTGVTSRFLLAAWQEYKTFIGTWDARASGLGGWSLDIHHAYDPASQTLYLGDGGQRSVAAQDVASVVTTVAGNRDRGYYGDGGPATQAAFREPYAVAVGPDGNFYIADSANHLVRRVAWDEEEGEWIIVRIAGIGLCPQGGDLGDNGPANEARICVPGSVALNSKGALYIGNAGLIRQVEPDQLTGRVEPDGIITTLAGGGNPSDEFGDGGPAKDAKLGGNLRVAVGPDDSIYIVDRGRVRRVWFWLRPGPRPEDPPEKIPMINTVAGGGNPPPGSIGDGGPAWKARLDDPSGVAVGPDGSLYIVEGGRVRRVGPDGIINKFAGGGQPSPGFGDGGPATQAYLSFPSGVAVGPEGEVYISEQRGLKIRRVSPDGIINTVAGGGSPPAGSIGDDGPATQALLSVPSDVEVGPDRALYIVDTGHQVIRKVASALPGFAVGDVLIAAEDGSEVYAFRGASGRHFKTLDALTGAVGYEFGYARVDRGRLATVTDGDGNVTRIERNTNDNISIVSPFGQQTKLEVNTDGYLETITNPAGEAVQLTYHPGGLLHTVADPRGVTDPKKHTYTFEYDELGRLKLDKDPEDPAAGGFSALVRTENGSGYKVALLTAEGRERHYQVERLPTGDEQRVNRCCGATEARMHTARDGTETITMPDGVETKVVRGPDPRWGMQSPRAQTVNVTTPGQRKLAISTDRKVTLADPSDPFSVSSIADTTTVNGQLYTRAYQVLADTATRTITDETPEGRRVVRTLDPRGRLVKMQVGNLRPVSCDYDDKGRLETITQETEPETRSFTFTYDADGYLETITDPLQHTTSFRYDAAGRVKMMTRPDGKAVDYSFDANGNLTSLTAVDRPAHGFPDYTPVNLISEYDPPDVDGMPDETSYEYNKDRQLCKIIGPDGRTVVADYDPSSGRLDTLTLPNGQMVYTYYPISGNLKSITTPDGIGLSYEYDGSLLTSENWTEPIAGSVEHTYDNNLRMSSQKLNSANAIEYQHDNDGLLIRAGDLVLHRDPDKGLQAGLLTGTTLGKVTDTRDYEDSGDLKGYSVAHEGTVIYSAKYTLRDSLGRIKEKTETVDGRTDTYVYRYDRVGRLEDVTKNGAPFATYTYDSNGNRRSYTGPLGTIAESGTSYDDQDRLGYYGNRTYTYTARGELESKTADGQRTTYEYDILGNLKLVNLPDGKQIEYVDDGANRRIGKKVDGTLVQGFLYGGQLRPAAELDGNGNVRTRFVYATGVNVPDYMIRGGKSYRIITDYLGSPRLVVDANTGEVVQRIDYDEFGNITKDTNPDFQPFGFAGGLYDQDTKLTRFGARDYDAEVGRWTAKDPSGFLAGDTNLYVYAANQPTVLIDPTGNAPNVDNWFKMCMRLEEKIANIRKDLLKRMEEHQADIFQQPQWCPGAKRKETRSGHALIIRDHLENLWKLEQEYRDKCGGPPPPPPLRSPFENPGLSPPIDPDELVDASGKAAVATEVGLVGIILLIMAGAAVAVP